MHEKYEKVIDLINNITEIHNDYNNAQENGSSDVDQIHKNSNIMFLKLINHLNKTFPAPISTNAVLIEDKPTRRVRSSDIESKIFENERTELKNFYEIDVTFEMLEQHVTGEKTIPEYLFPIMVIRYVFKNELVKFDPRIPFIENGKETYPFREFSIRFAELIVAS